MRRDLLTGNLFSKKSDVRLSRITKRDMVFNGDNLTALRKLIISHQIKYPNIDEWFDDKVIHGIKSGNRIAYVGFMNDKPILSAVLKLDENAKFCHVSITESAQNCNIGEIVFSMMTLDAHRKAKRIHFTLPESLWSEKKSFFESFGFRNPIVSERQYRMNDKELCCDASFTVVWDHVLQKLPKITSTIIDSSENLFGGVLLSIKPEYVKRIFLGQKTVEIRKRFDKKWQNRKVIIYSSSPVQALVGYATIDYIIEGRPDEIWERFGDCIGGSKEEYYDYTSPSASVFAIVLKNIDRYLEEIPIFQINHWLGKDIKAPQSHVSLRKNSLWCDAVSIAELLHNRFHLETINCYEPHL